MNVPVTLEVDTSEGIKNVRALAVEVEALAKSADAIPFKRVKWFALAIIATHAIGALALLGIAIALMRGH